MKIHSDSPLSKIEQLFNNLDSNLSKNQYIRLQFKLNGYKEKKLGQDQVIIETSLIDGQYSQTAILIGKAAELIKVYQKIYQCEFYDIVVTFNFQKINFVLPVIQLLQWKVAYLEKNKAYTIVIYEFQYIGSLDGEHECTQYNVEQNCQSQKKLRVTIKQHNTINNNTSHQQYITNSIKKVKIENSSFTKDSFIIDDNLLNISALDNPANNKQSNQFKDYQQQQQIQQSELTKISAMYPNMKKWVLEGRIILKSEQLDFRCKKTDTIQRYFKIIILDCEQEIIVGLFYEKALSKFFSVLQQGKVYTFKNGCIGQDKANGIVDLIYGYNLNYINGYNIQQPLNLFNFFCAFLNIFINCNSIPKSAKLKINCNNILILQIYICFEYINTKKISFNEYSIISESQNFAIPSAPQLNFSTLQEIETLQHNSIVDVVAVIQEIKQDSDSCKSFIVFDQTTRLSVKLWGAQYANINLQKGEVMVFKGLKFYNTNFKSLNSDHQTMIIQNHDLNEVKQLKSWLAGKNIDTIMKPNPDNSTIDLQQLDEFVIKQLNEGKTQQANYKYIFGYIIEIQENRNMYPCCPSLRCKSKMEEIPSRKTYRCKKCLTENPSPKFSFVLRVTIMDEFTNIKAVIFDDIAVKLLGITADQLRAMSHEDQRNIFLSKEFQQKKMKLQIQFQDYNGQIQPKYNVQDIVDIDYKVLATQAFEMFDELDNLLNLSLVL